MIKISNKKKGFSLIEMLVAISLFVIIVFVSVGAILSVFDANKRAQSTKTVVDNLNLSIEDMARTVRFGKNYRCDSGTNCPSGGTRLTVDFEGGTIAYRLNGTALQRSDDGGLSYKPITSPETVIDYVRFYVFGTAISGNAEQPYVIAVVRGYVGTKPTTQSRFSIETVMSQRTLDI